jgi:hypothetical protein
MDVQGRLVAVLPSITGQGQKGTWKKQEFIVETMEQYPKKICFEAWNDDCRQLDDLQQGNVLKVNFNVESREFESKWYTQCKCWKIQVIGK